jgi:hypothetical protein
LCIKTSSITISISGGLKIIKVLLGSNVTGIIIEIGITININITRSQQIPIGV